MFGLLDYGLERSGLLGKRWVRWFVVCGEEVLAEIFRC